MRQAGASMIHTFEVAHVSGANVSSAGRHQLKHGRAYAYCSITEVSSHSFSEVLRDFYLGIFGDMGTGWEGLYIVFQPRNLETQEFRTQY